jgi:ABC-type sulfate transport system permease component
VRLLPSTDFAMILQDVAPTDFFLNIFVTVNFVPVPVIVAELQPVWRQLFAEAGAVAEILGPARNRLCEFK